MIFRALAREGVAGALALTVCVHACGESSSHDAGNDDGAAGDTAGEAGTLGGSGGNSGAGGRAGTGGSSGASGSNDGGRPDTGGSSGTDGGVSGAGGAEGGVGGDGTDGGGTRAQWVVYTTPKDLYAVDFSGSTPEAPIALNPPLQMNEEVFFPTVQPHGPLFAFHIWAPGYKDLFTTNFGGAAPSKATRVSTPFPQHTNLVGDAVFSPDGRRLAYDLTESGTNRGLGVFLVDTSGAIPGSYVEVSEPLTYNFGMFNSWWRGSRFYFRGLSSMSDSAWIPGHRLYSIDTSSWPPGAPVPETDWSADLSWFTYLPSPDGRRVAYWKEMDPFQDEINVVGLGSENPVAPTPIHPTPTAEEPTDFVLWSPDGSSIYFVLVMSEVNTRRILRTRFDDQGPLPMESLTAPGHISDVKLSADGARLAFVQYESPDSDAGDLWVVDVSGPTPGAPERLTNLAAFGGGVAYNGGRQFHFTADSRHVVYAAGERAGGAAEAFVVNVDGPATPRRLHPDPPSADSYVKQIWLSPDTSVVVLNAELETPGRMEAFALRLAADVPSALTKLNGPLRSGEEVYGIDWSGDGRSIAVSVGLPEPRTLRIEIATDDGLRFHAGVPVSAPEHEAYRPQFVAERRGE